jgi:Uma2 family endonuclease
MATAPTKRATVEDLYGVEGKAELIGGEIIPSMSPGHIPSQVALEIAFSLREYARQRGQGFAYADAMIFAVPELSSGRQSFSPDAAYYAGQMPANRMRAVENAPTFAVEVRSQSDYGSAAEREMAAKRADYFEAGTLVVWDVDPEAELIHVYRLSDPNSPTTYARCQKAEAEPAAPGWSIAVDAVFDQA